MEHLTAPRPADGALRFLSTDDLLRIVEALRPRAEPPPRPASDSGEEVGPDAVAVAELLLRSVGAGMR